jgi:hypothetical protein
MKSLGEKLCIYSAPAANAAGAEQLLHVNLFWLFWTD